MHAQTIDLDMAERAVREVAGPVLCGYSFLTIDSTNWGRTAFLATFPSQKDPIDCLLLANVPGKACFDAC